MPFTPPKLTGAPTYKNTVSRSDMSSWRQSQVSGISSVFAPFCSHLTAQHLSHLCPREAHQLTTVAEEGLASDTQGHRALPAGDGSRMVEGERGNLSLFCFLRASSESSDWVIFFF